MAKWSKASKGTNEINLIKIASEDRLTAGA
jgi:hypothetical protein